MATNSSSTSDGPPASKKRPLATGMMDKFVVKISKDDYERMANAQGKIDHDDRPDIIHVSARSKERPIYSAVDHTYPLQSTKPSMLVALGYPSKQLSASSKCSTSLTSFATHGSLAGAWAWQFW